ncbi:retrovirus-related Pol polyprotein from transposon 297 [Trichinella spiralis]|uniref:retrovirus-related Pol polyprotein from transposon 297 n=1 Tax=Trichinella spiralis TaxID=6334 RepID=UPI0001EFE46E|nr:retrovirus-related Pol polyprotein from transposon 297 [Trichinella spiralis]
MRGGYGPASTKKLSEMSKDCCHPMRMRCIATWFGAVLCHKLSSTQEIPITFYSRTLSTMERNYGQIDKEALAVIAGVKKFHEYLYGRQFTIITDHKPLFGLFVPKKETPQILSPRMLPGHGGAGRKSVSDERLKPYVDAST